VTGAAQQAAMELIDGDSQPSTKSLDRLSEDSSTSCRGPHWLKFTGPVQHEDDPHPLGRGSIEMPVSGVLRPWLAALRLGIQTDPGGF